MSRRARTRPPARAVKPLSRTITLVVGEELERAFYRTGRRILSLYLETLAQPQAIAITNSPDRLRAAVESAIAAASRDELEMKQLIQYSARGMAPATRDCLALLDQTLRSQRALIGIPLDDATEMIARQLQHRISPRSLAAMLTRNALHHKLVVKNRRVMLRADILLNILESRHQKARQRKGLV